MPDIHRPLISSLAFAALFTFLFHDTGIGLNLLLFELAFFGFLLVRRRLPPRRDVIITTGATLLTAVFVVLHGSTLALVMNLISSLFALGVLLAPELGALHRSAVLALSRLLATPRALLRALPIRRQDGLALGITPRGAVASALVPLIVLLFATLYSASNPVFGELTDRFYHWLGEIDASLPFVFLLGLLLSGAFLLASRSERLLRWAGLGTDALIPGPLDDARTATLRTEVRTGVLLLGLLNALLLLLNVLDVHHVWFHFTFTGQYLKQFVHQGTWLLIISILLGAFIVLYFFRGDMNFHDRSRTLRLLSYAWLAQNAVLAVSVGVRNYWYIHHYALAYKRIGVAFFLLAIMIGLALILLKVRERRTHHFLARWNMLALFLVAVVMSAFDWDSIIARYNMAHREKTFVELDFLATLDDKALPYLTRSRLELENLDSYNAQFLGEERYTRALYMDPNWYARIIRMRTQEFLRDYPERSWREWNLADSRSHAVLAAAYGPPEEDQVP